MVSRHRIWVWIQLWGQIRIDDKVLGDVWGPDKLAPRHLGHGQGIRRSAGKFQVEVVWAAGVGVEGEKLSLVDVFLSPDRECQMGP